MKWVDSFEPYRGYIKTKGNADWKDPPPNHSNFVFESSAEWNEAKIYVQFLSEKRNYDSHKQSKLKAWSLPSKVNRNVFYTVKLVTEQHLDTQRKRQRHKTTVKITGSARNVRIKQKRNFLVSTAITCHDLYCVSRYFYILLWNL